MVATLSVVILFCGLWVMFKPDTAEQSAESLQGILMEHIEYLPEVYRAHDNYANCLYKDTCAVLVYRYSSGWCSSCYLDDLADLKDFRKTIGWDMALVLPAYPINDRNSRIQMYNETTGFRYRNIPADSLALPKRAGGDEKRYFAVVDKHGKIGMVFFPVRGRQDLTRMYFRRVERYFKDLKNENGSL